MMGYSPDRRSHEIGGGATGPERSPFKGDVSAAPSLPPLSHLPKLSEFRLFAGVSGEQLEQLFRVAEVRRFSPGGPIDTPRGKVLVTLSGEAECYLNDAAGQKFLLSAQKPGSPLGELSHLVQGRGYEEKVTVVARSELTAYQLPVEAFFQAVLSTPQSSIAYIDILASRLADMNRFGKQAVDVNMDPSSVQPRNFQERLADVITEKIGGFSFLGAMGFISAGWVALNVGLIGTIGWDPYPFVFLNLMYSVMSGMTLPVILISQNRQAQLDRQAARVRHLVTLNSARIVDDMRARLVGLDTRLDAFEARLPPVDRAQYPENLQ